MILAALTLALIPEPPALPVRPDLKEIKAQFEALHAKSDRAGCVALWKSNPASVLPVIDRDLEGSLKLAEGKAPDEARIRALHERALWGARAAALASGHPILADYAASFVGWTAEQKSSFRAGQAAFAQASQALEKKDGKAALAAARECIERALPLGDWWGTAMGADAQGAAHRLLGEKEPALTAFSRARILYHDLGLASDELSCARAIAELCAELGRPQRALEALDSALALATALGDEPSKSALIAQRSAIEAKIAK